MNLYPIENMAYLGQVMESKDKSRQFRIVNGGDKWISKRVIRYKTSFGDSSAGSEIAYGHLNDALEAESRWLKGENNV